MIYLSCCASRGAEQIFQELKEFLQSPSVLLTKQLQNKSHPSEE